MDAPANRSRRWLLPGAALLTGLIWSGPARSDLITPDSSPNPPPSIPYVDGAPIPSPAYVLTNQYAAKGLLFVEPAPDLYVPMPLW